MGGGVERYEVIVVGAGPAGSATALALAERDPALAARTLVLDKARHPRDKTCAGGLIPRALSVLRELGVDTSSVPAAGVDVAAVAVPGGRVRIAGRGLCHVVRRRDLDGALARAAAARGVTLREDARVVGLVREGGGVRVETADRVYRAPVIVGADGSGSIVRRRLVNGPAGRLARAVMCDVPVARTRWTGHAERRYEFDFLGLERGVRGYGWLFPCVIRGEPHVNAGVYALPPYDAGVMHRELARLLAGIGVHSNVSWKAFPIRVYDAGARLAAPHVLLTGDAAGVDPLMGEGISFALEYARLAAAAIVETRSEAAHGFPAYERAVHEGALGRKLQRLAWAAERCYGPRWRWWFRAARASGRLRRAALDWYNGVAPWEGRGRLALARALVGAPRRAA